MDQTKEAMNRVDGKVGKVVQAMVIGTPGQVVTNQRQITKDGPINLLLLIIKFTSDRKFSPSFPSLIF